MRQICIEQAHDKGLLKQDSVIIRQVEWMSTFTLSYYYDTGEANDVESGLGYWIINNKTKVVSAITLWDILLK